MRIEILLVTAYLLLAFWLIPKFSLVRNSDLTAFQARGLLALKLLSGLVCAYYFKTYSATVDYVGYNERGEIQYKLLLSDPVLFFTDFRTDLHTYGIGGLFDSKD